MGVFAIADLHLSFGNNKEMDIFNGWENYTVKIKDNWTKIVKNDDTVVISGDISWGMNLEDTVEDFKFINELPGKKIISRGNHDYWWTTANKMKKFFEENEFNTLSILFNNSYFVDGMAICGTRGWPFPADSQENLKVLKRETMRLQRSIEEGKKLSDNCIVFLHYPPVYKNRECDEFLDILKQNDIKKCYFGHIHGKDMNGNVMQGKYKGIDFELISCDYLNFFPARVTW